MNAQALKSLARAQVACAALLAAGAGLAGQHASTTVAVKVKLVTSSGVCAAVANRPVVQVSCTVGGGPLLPIPGEVPYRLATSLPTTGLLDLAMGPGLVPVSSDGTRISSWRVVQLNDARYLELTIAW